MDGPSEAVDWPGLEAILAEDPEAMAAYVELMTVHALLRWRSGRLLASADVPPPSPSADGPRRSCRLRANSPLPPRMGRDEVAGQGKLPSPSGEGQGVRAARPPPNLPCWAFSAI